MPIGSGPALNWSTSQDVAGRDQGFRVANEWLLRPYRRAPRSPTSRELGLDLMSRMTCSEQRVGLVIDRALKQGMEYA